MREVAGENNLPLETEKEEVLHLRKNRKKRNADRKYVKWLGVIFHDSLDFDIHWKSRIGICLGGWKKAYEGMIRSIVIWGAELGWRGQKA